ncbi:Ribokinase [Halomicronema hongdechloris C2206]|uniref:Ribokinase n=1 Tax=Halomicronema hongdechloris C2206 TaxID=1641165 RepID=A0A1Z3HM02_9CYAN|nr:ribokinase [Halomicronema hongdechloris]ASC71320.1 Ribokinase [Halomicronema hongdechloris C2206]
MIHVFGSINLDLVIQAPRLPRPGETVLGTRFDQIPGGKGANQAVAAARAGASVRMVGRVGNDSFGQNLLDNLQAAGVSTQAVQIDANTSSGVAMISVAADGSNQILVVPGANGQVNQSDVARLLDPLQPGDWLLLQFELPLAVVMAAAKQARAAQVQVMVDPAPAPENLPDWFFAAVDILTPNHLEASQLVGFEVCDGPQGPVFDHRTSATAAVRALQQRGVPTVILTLGEQGAIVATADEVFHVPAFSVPVVDTVAAGDAFNGALAVALSQGKSLRTAVQWASAAAALSVGQAGAQPSLPTCDRIEAFLQAH